LRQTAQTCGFSYVTQQFELLPGKVFPVARAPQVAELRYGTALAFPGDNGRFHLSMTIASGDPLRHRLLDQQNLLRALGAVEPLRAWCAAGRAVGAPLPMAGLENRFRRLVHADGPVVTGFIQLGDAALQTNPTFGRGVTMALCHAHTVARLLDESDRHPVAWSTLAHQRTEEVLGGWYDLQVATDAARLRALRENAGSEPSDPRERLIGKMLTALSLLREEDAEVRIAGERVYNMLTTPQELMADRYVARRLLAFIRTHPDATRAPTGPSREELERLIPV
jgi:2-polyprenyl-6-methoxyphenol hydroxylase-like FAD-dependent oxidoreductase